MKKLMTLFVLALLVMATVPTVASASAAKGQKIFKEKLRKQCGFSGVRFARNHTQSEWEDIYESGAFKAEAEKICPRLHTEKIKESWWKHLYDFVHKYAKDGIIPKC
jgi:hypothetical protein